ncbi:MAG: glycoside hydrolase family 27 protein, partial [Clostridia bacterium]
KLLYRRMGLALANCGRDILLSACSWGIDETHTWIKETGAHMWRSTGDITDNWQSIKSLYEKQFELIPYNGQGCFNDMDMLVVGMHGKGNVALGGCTLDEYKTHFSIWSMFQSPLMIGCDIRSMDDEIKSVLTNKQIIEINQDVAGRQAYLACNTWGSVVWAKHLEGGDIVLGMFNMNDDDAYPFIPFTSLGLNRTTGVDLEIYDIWENKNLGIFKDVYRSTCVKPHACRMLRCKLIQNNK